MQIKLHRFDEIESSVTNDEKGHIQKVYLCALEYVKNGLYVVPLQKNNKMLPSKKYNFNYGHASNNKNTIEKWFNPDNGTFTGWNIGLATGKENGIFAIDVDMHGTENGFLELNKILDENDDKLEGPCQKTPKNGKHYIFQWQENASSSTSKIAPGIDTRGGTETACKGHIVVYPSIVNDKQYEWIKGGEIPFIPKWALERLGIIWKPKKFNQRGNENISADDEELQLPVEQLNEMLEAINPDELTYDEWLKIGQAINTQYPTEEGLKIWDEWSSQGDRYKPNECIIRWRGFDPTGPVRAGSLFYYAKQSGWEPTKDNIKAPKNMEIIERLNSQFAVVVVGGKIKILREKDYITDPVLGHYDLMDKESFRILMQNDITEYIDNNGKVKYVSVADLWLANSARRTFPNGMRLRPDRKGHDEGYYNTWNGFSTKPREGDCSLLLDHIEKVICNGSIDNYNWLIDWCADCIQDPANPKGTCVVLRGEEGAGKGTLANTMGELFGCHYRHLIDDSHLLSNFNAHMIDALFVFADEITWGGNQKTAGKLKGMVTEEWLVGERKGVDAVGYRNMTHMIIASNSDWVIPAGTNSRRWFMLDVSAHKVGNREHFNSINHQLNNGGKEAFLHYLMNREIISDLRSAPRTKALESQRIKSIRFNTILHWWTGCLHKGKLNTEDIYYDPNNQQDWPSHVVKSDLYEEYERYCEERKMTPEHMIMFGTEMKKLGLSDYRPTVNGRKKRAYKIHSLEQCIEIVESNHGISVDSQDNEDD